MRKKLIVVIVSGSSSSFVDADSELGCLASEILQHQMFLKAEYKFCRIRGLEHVQSAS